MKIQEIREIFDKFKTLDTGKEKFIFNELKNMTKNNIIKLLVISLNEITSSTIKEVLIEEPIMNER